MKDYMLCIHCHEPVTRLLIMGLLADLGCKGSCENANLCPNLGEGKEHEFYYRSDLDAWDVKGYYFEGYSDDIVRVVYTPKGSSLTDVWKYAKIQHPTFNVSKILRKKVELEWERS